MNTTETNKSNSSANVRDFVIGRSDGLTVPFALAAGLTGAISDTSIIVTQGLQRLRQEELRWDLAGIWQAEQRLNITTHTSAKVSTKFKIIMTAKRRA